jgi:hypothetical protein
MLLQFLSKKLMQKFVAKIFSRSFIFESFPKIFVKNLFIVFVKIFMVPNIWFYFFWLALVGQWASLLAVLVPMRATGCGDHT